MRLLISLALLSACPSVEEPPEQPPLQPVEREADLFWTVDDALPTGFDAASLLPTAILLGPDAAPALTGDVDVAFEAVLAALEAAAPGIALGVTVPMLPGEVPNELCFDPGAPTQDEFLRTRQDALVAQLQGSESLQAVVVDPGTGTAPANVLCFCEPCTAPGDTGQANRLSALWTLHRDAATDGAASAWMWDRDPSGLDANALDLFRSDLHPGTDLLTRAGAREAVSIWAPDPPAIDDGGRRRVAADIDADWSHHGPVSIGLLDPFDLVDRVRRHRLTGVETWFLGLGGGAPGAPATVGMTHDLFLDFGATPQELLSAWILDRWGLDAATPEGEALLLALSSTGRALELSTHPLGIAVADTDLGVPGAGPLTFIEPADEAWAERYTGTQAPGQADLLQAHQWLFEGVNLAESALQNFEIAAPALPQGDATELRRQLDLLLLATNAWARRLDAEFALKFGGPGVAWSLGDADALDALANTAEAIPTDTFPVDPTALRAAAEWIRTEAGPGTAAQRPFPIIKNVRYDFAEDRTNVRWRVEPSGTGWSERGSEWPVYPDSSAVGTQDAAEWTAWVRQLAANTRFTFRACSDSAGFTVCSADNVLWTPP